MSVDRGRTAVSAALRTAVTCCFLSLCLVVFSVAAHGSSSAGVSTNVTVAVLGVDGSVVGGRVGSAPAGIACPPACSAAFDGPATLTEVADPGWVFDGWGGDCPVSTASTCVTGAGPTFAATANFRPASSLAVVVRGAGTITSTPAGFDMSTGQPAGIDCGASAQFGLPEVFPQLGDRECTVGYPAGTRVTLTAHGMAGFSLEGWGRYNCPATTDQCALTTADPGDTVRAAFNGNLLATVVSGHGRVSSSPPGIDCGNGGNVCLGYFPTGSVVQLTATPQGDPFSSWGSLECGEISVCQITISHDELLTPAFGLTVTVLEVVNETAYVTADIGGLGSGTVTLASGDGSTSCVFEGPPCSKLFRAPETVTLTAAADGGSSPRWLAGCPAQTSSCQVDTEFINSAAVCFAPTSAVHGVTQLHARRVGRRRRLRIGLTSLRGVQRAKFSLVRRGVVVATWPAFSFAEMPSSFTVYLPARLLRGSYTVRTNVVDNVGCPSTLAPRTVAVPSP